MCVEPESPPCLGSALMVESWGGRFLFSRQRQVPLLSPVVSWGHRDETNWCCFSPHSFKEMVWMGGCLSHCSFHWGGWRLCTVEESPLLTFSEGSRGSQHRCWVHPVGDPGSLSALERDSEGNQSNMSQEDPGDQSTWETFTEKFRTFKKNLENLHSFSAYKHHICSL